MHVLDHCSKLEQQEGQDLPDVVAQYFSHGTQTRVMHVDDVCEGMLGVVGKQVLIVIGPRREYVCSRFLYGYDADPLANRASCSVPTDEAEGRKLTAWFLGLLKAIGQRLAAGNEKVL